MGLFDFLRSLFGSGERENGAAAGSRSSAAGPPVFREILAQTARSRKSRRVKLIPLRHRAAPESSAVHNQSITTVRR